MGLFLWSDFEQILIFTTDLYSYLRSRPTSSFVEIRSTGAGDGRTDALLATKTISVNMPNPKTRFTLQRIQFLANRITRIWPAKTVRRFYTDIL